MAQGPVFPFFFGFLSVRRIDELVLLLQEWPYRTQLFFTTYGIG